MQIDGNESYTNWFSGIEHKLIVRNQTQIDDNL